ncbi:AAA family ATPase [Alteribacter natronophilus]|uniref:AAA family ATPase n=1 Tax=Alteribacter natronophilus TaxID=2583810 RepID=UPI00110D3650|nr:AAA family ATPase [Alteribacter natronophilus]TMW71403.1 ATP-binding protein [Alteribacter natronophilus]
MKRLAVITVGKTHSGKSTFARDLERQLQHSFVLDQDNHAEFINKFYPMLQPKTGPNTLKHSISKLIVDYAKEHTDLHIIASSANRNRKGREYLLEEIFNPDEFFRVLVHFDIPDEILYDRVIHSKRSTAIFRGSYSNFKEVLLRQQAESQLEDVADPEAGEADHLFVIRQNEEADSVIKEIVGISKCL